ncbi:MAG: ATP synthase F1 subunit epsilon [Verrucomicrobia bacterium]|nr:ATP synthase F1 subunit epsilon [Verrucomicrobiota bacterium]MCG2680973.1 ATP synthase F1 subunit epsilon [Kiritimatiellia bacterium]MBU4248144.1 ATP synthase F1 subunit epsilon [Verrucomicrobiota bacterium]MBU4290281.1 ATP synthase F1 subunit epsilon [Verrucomicrobiota bacterium]MBU4428706.1 ATP synthase F1 subunit epsilon [Verrucomicrobiota bacterium]
MSTFPLEILTPDQPFFKENVASVVVKGSEGFLGILAHHAPFLARLAPGPLQIQKDDGEQVFAAGAGLVEVTPAGVTILVDSAEPAAGSDAAKPH